MVVGNGAREHALTSTVAKSSRVAQVWTAPGNGGTAHLSAGNVPVDPMDGAAVARAAQARQVDLVIVGADDPLAAGVVDALQAAGINAFGPTQAAAQIEASKVWSKEFMRRHGIPTAPYEIFDSAPAAHAYVDSHPGPLVVKADGLARGKGVIVCDAAAEAQAAITEIMERHAFGVAGDRIVVEQRLEGPEASVFAVCDGETAVPFEAARDHKRIGEGDRGPNTGGMGAYSPTTLVTPSVLDDVMARIVHPVVRGMAREGRPFTGFLYTGLMFTADGPQVIEFNARFGDPEAQAILPRLETDLVEVIELALARRLSAAALRWRVDSTCAVCVASEGYPGPVRDGFPIVGLNQMEPDALVFHAGTVERDGEIITKGGRVLTIVGTGRSLAEARQAAYHNVNRVHFEGMQYRRDIGAREDPTA
jgi:phosphoribosylamine---glycine ligase